MTWSLLLQSWNTKAAEIRDQISQLQNVQAAQNIEGTRGDLDLLAVFTEHGHACVQVLFVREARVLGSRSYYPQIRLDESPRRFLRPSFRSFTCRVSNRFLRKSSPVMPCRMGSYWRRRWALNQGAKS